MKPRTPRPFVHILAHVLAIGAFVYSLTFVLIGYLFTRVCLVGGNHIGMSLAGLMTSVAAIYATGVAVSKTDLSSNRAYVLVMLALMALTISIALPVLYSLMCVHY